MKQPIPKPTQPVLHPNAQVLITGKPLNPVQAQEVMAFTQDLSLNGWCASDGSIGHLDSIKPNTTYEKLWSDLQALSVKFPFLDMGISVMSGPPGSFNLPLVSFHLHKSKLRKDPMAHMTHPPPQRLKRV